MISKEKEDQLAMLNTLKQQQQVASSASVEEATAAVTEKLKAAEKERDDIMAKLEEKEAELKTAKDATEKLQTVGNRKFELRAARAGT